MALALVAFGPSVWLLFVPTVIFGVAQSLNLSNVFSLLNEAAPDDNRGAFLALNSTLLRLGQTLGPVLIATIAASLASPAPTSSPAPWPSRCSCWHSR